MAKLRDESTAEGYRIWANVDLAASRAPSWLKSQVCGTKMDRVAARAWAKRKLEDDAPGPPDSYNDKVRAEMCQPCECDACCAARVVLFALKKE